MGKKKTKAQLEAEAEELAALEAKAAAKAEKLRLEEERLAAEAAAALQLANDEARAAEFERLASEAAAAAAAATTKHARHAEKEAAARKQAEWEAYIACDDAPSAAPADVNTFVSELSALPVPADLDEALATTAASAALSRALLSAPVAETAGWVAALRSLASARIDDACGAVLGRVDAVLTASGPPLEASTPQGVSVALWANVPSWQKKYKRTVPIKFPQCKASLVISKTTAEKPIAIRFTAFPYDAVTAPGVSADVKVIGGVFGVHVLHLPPPPTKVVVENKGTLVMRPTIIEEGVSEAGLRHSSYPYGSDLNPSLKSTAAPIVVTVTVPPTTVVDEDGVQVMRWDATVGWTDAKVENVGYRAEDRVLTWTTTEIGYFAIVQNPKTDVPYTEWSIAPHSPSPEDSGDDLDGALSDLRLTTAHHTVAVRVNKNGMCKVTEPELPELEAVRASWSSPSHVLDVLAASGLMVTPGRPDGAQPTAALERALAAQLAEVATSFDLQGSRWNTDAPGSESSAAGERRYVQIRETSVFVGGNVMVLPWLLAMAESDALSASARTSPTVAAPEGSAPAAYKFSLLAIREATKEYDAGPYRGAVSSATLLGAMAKPASAESKERVAESPPPLSAALQELLLGMNVLSNCAV